MKWVKSSELKDKGTRKPSSTLFYCLHSLIWIHYHIVMICYARGFALYLAKCVHDSIEVKPHSFMLSWKLIMSSRLCIII